MINAELGHCKTVEEFYKSIREQQEEAHGHDYCEQHDAMMRLAPECKTYAELGVHQGGTLACALLAGFKYVEGVDVDMHRYEKFLKPLAEEYAKENKIVLKMKNVDSGSLESIGPNVDILLIDSYHKAFHMARELKVHAKRANKYIIAHDTAKPTAELDNCLMDFLLEHPEWSLLERSVNNVGYMVLKRNG